MKARFEDSFYARVYLWVSKAKYTMGIFFVAYVVLYLGLGLFASTKIVIDIFTAIQMMFACFFIGLLKQSIVPDGKLTYVRAGSWMVLSVGITALFGAVFKWFQDMPVWTSAFFVIAMTAGMIAAILSYYLELHQETKAMNDKLVQFKNQKMEE